MEFSVLSCKQKKCCVKTLKIKVSVINDNEKSNFINYNYLYCE